MRRRFTTQERVALYLAADGRCVSCNRDLEPGWHADHIRAWSRGGKTDVVNGQALCPQCNLQKGYSVATELRKWQAACLRRYVMHQGRDFVLGVCPAAGKTRLAIEAARMLFERGEVDNVIVVVNTTSLRKQWADAAAKCGIRLHYEFSNGDGIFSKDFHGIVVTYHAVRSQPVLYRKLSRRALIIFDEIHHAGDNDWGTAVQMAFEEAPRRLLMTGTPKRTDEAAIPFVRYDGQYIVTDYLYSYGEAIQDNIVRPVEFIGLNGDMRWVEAGNIEQGDLLSGPVRTQATRLRTALLPTGDWIKSVFRQAHQDLLRRRSVTPDAGGLIVASDVKSANEYAKILGAITGEKATVVVHDDKNAGESIRQFREGSSCWLVAVQMVSEGVDIPRLEVLVYATNVLTELFFKQVIGRVLRGAETTAVVYMPCLKVLMDIALSIREIVTKALREIEEQAQESIRVTGSGGPVISAIEPLSSSEASHHLTIADGESFTMEELSLAQSLRDKVGIAADKITEAQVARLIRASELQAATSAASQEQETPVDYTQQNKQLRKLIQNKVGKLSMLTGEEYRSINTRLMQACSDTGTKSATEENLLRRLQLLDKWMTEV